mmetsp:Transcript_40424/g.114471  ORF Transcript_40424/g.114471 Transcript_40424/m.114471 type:complete len:83 (-) Transcript_40424:330-578(-)
MDGTELGHTVLHGKILDKRRPVPMRYLQDRGCEHRPSLRVLLKIYNGCRSLSVAALSLLSHMVPASQLPCESPVLAMRIVVI